MTKKEQAYVESLKRDLADARAWHRTDPVKPNVLIPTEFKVLSKGWLFNSHNDKIEPACSSPISHSRGLIDSTTTQGAKELYDSKLTALRALRHEVENICAQRLAEIDTRIKAELFTIPEAQAK